MTNYQPFQIFLSPAKLNLGLRVIGRRADGYHLLKTVFCLIDLFDQIATQITDQDKVSLVGHNQAWSYQKDLAYQAAMLLKEFSQTKLGVNIRINKLIPSGGGMGGGSSNAATILLALNQLWNINLPLEQLMTLGTQLGADVPFFIFGRNALGTGIGDQLTAIDIPETHFVIINPKFRIPTKNIFTNLKLNFDQIDPNLITAEQLLHDKTNDLEITARQLYPQLNAIFNELSQYGKAYMTGSGSSIYFAFNDKNMAKKLANILQARYNTYLATSLVSSPVSVR